MATSTQIKQRFLNRLTAGEFRSPGHAKKMLARMYGMTELAKQYCRVAVNEYFQLLQEQTERRTQPQQGKAQMISEEQVDKMVKAATEEIEGRENELKEQWHSIKNQRDELEVRMDALDGEISQLVRERTALEREIRSRFSGEPPQVQEEQELQAPYGLYPEAWSRLSVEEKDSVMGMVMHFEAYVTKHRDRFLRCSVRSTSKRLRQLCEQQGIDPGAYEGRIQEELLDIETGVARDVLKNVYGETGVNKRFQLLYRAGALECTEKDVTSRSNYTRSTSAPSLSDDDDEDPRTIGVYRLKMGRRACRSLIAAPFPEILVEPPAETPVEAPTNTSIPANAAGFLRRVV